MSGGISKSKRPWHARIRRRIRLDYLKILRTHGAPAQVARGVGYGIFVELIFFPTLGLAFFLIYALNKYLKGHFTVSIASFVFAKLFAWATILPSILLGAWLLSIEVSQTVVKDTVRVLVYEWGMYDALSAWLLGVTQNPVNLGALDQLWSFIYAWILGGAIFGVVLGVGGFAVSWVGLKKYQAHRNKRR